MDLVFNPLSLRSSTDHDAIISSILADIPLIAVGVLAFCTLSFLVTMKRLTLIWACLHVSALVALLASILDMTQALSKNSNDGDSKSVSSSSSAVAIAGDIGFSLSNGLRLLFFWFYVAEPPHGETLFLLGQNGSHSGAWLRWGVIGFVLQWSTLAMIVAAVVLQHLWRIFNTFAGFSPLYNADVAIEIILSAVLLLKLGLNTWICTSVPRRKTLLTYSGFMLALGLNVGIWMGNLISLRFTESVLGRFLQAFEFYIMIFSVLLTAFYRQRASQSDSPRKNRISPFLPIPSGLRESTFRISPPNSSTPDIPSQAAIKPSMTIRDGQPARAQRNSSVSQISSWLVSRGWQISGRPRVFPENDAVRLWNHDEAERGNSPVDPVSPDLSLLEKVTVMDDKINMPESPTSLAYTDYVQVDHPNSGARGGPFTATLYSGTSARSQYSDAGTQGPVTNPLRLVPSVTKKSRRSPSLSSRSSNISGLLRQQEELDNSIAALRLFHNRSSAGNTEAGSLPSPSSTASDPHSKRLNVASVLAPSDISLSNFPQPPRKEDGEIAEAGSKLSPRTPTRDVVQKEDSTTIGLDRSESGSTRDSDLPFDLVPPRMPAAVAESGRQQSVLSYDDIESDMLLSTRSAKFDSKGTQYDVTSFIGNLTTPGHKKDGSSSTKVTDYNSDDDEATIVTLNRTNSQFARPVYIESPLGRSQFTDQVVNPTGVGRGSGPLTGPQRTRLEISNPTMQRTDIMSGAFEMPRPAPLVTRVRKDVWM